MIRILAKTATILRMCHNVLDLISENHFFKPIQPTEIIFYPFLQICMEHSFFNKQIRPERTIEVAVSLLRFITFGQMLACNKIISVNP